MLESRFLSSVDPVLLAKMVSCHWHMSKKEFTRSINLSAIQLAKLSGFSPIITTASLKHGEYLKSIGATHVIDRSISASNLVSEISRITQNVPIKYAVDSISLPDTQQTAYDLLGEGGKLAIFRPPAAKTTEEKEIFYIYGLLREPSNIELLESLLHDNLERLLKEGAIKVSHSRKCPPVYLLTD
jgi:NADPH:quinone reductase-like Zn-dependent oxidoreductase